MHGCSELNLLLAIYMLFLLLLMLIDDIFIVAVHTLLILECLPKSIVAVSTRSRDVSHSPVSTPLLKKSFVVRLEFAAAGLGHDGPLSAFSFSLSFLISHLNEYRFYLVS